MRRLRPRLLLITRVRTALLAIVAAILILNNSTVLAVSSDCSSTGGAPSSSNFCYTDDDTGSFNNSGSFYKFGDSVCGTAEAIATASSSANIDTSAAQEANAKTVIGIAKTENLGKAGALIGLMVAITESSLKIYANSNVPLSLNNPNKQAVGGDHDSLGVFQQRISTDWSTISSNPNDQAAVNQLMDPAYNAEAFFGSAPGSAAAKELSKGLQNHTDWASKDPWAAAQDTQTSAYDGRPRAANHYSSVYGGNYQAVMPRAQALLTQYYDSSPAVPLPVPLSGGTTSTTSASASVDTTAACGDSQGGPVAGNIVATAMNLAWNDMPKPKPKNGPDSASCYALDSSGVPQVVSPAPATCYHGFQQRGESVSINGSSHSISPTTYTKSVYQQAYTKYENGVNSTDFTDCGVFVATVMRSSGADPTYQQITTGEQLKYVRNSGKYTVYPKFNDSSELKAGDILITDGHTYIYLGNNKEITDKTHGWTVAEASQGNHSPEVDANPYPSDGGEVFAVARLKQ